MLVVRAEPQELERRMQYAADRRLHHRAKAEAGDGHAKLCGREIESQILADHQRDPRPAPGKRADVSGHLAASAAARVENPAADRRPGWPAREARRGSAGD